ncbi:MAG: hypothetical protein Q9191_008097 [Dirinaria sp. TL-2023a]
MPTSANAQSFITNLKLLGLDTRDDWPSITVQVLSSKDVQQNQKHRIHCVEWALYRLFEIWNPEETKNKLQPFFPPLAPLQSLNLRAALFRCLNELKKNGVLGREVTIRKTMLDECKGEKLEELLVSFSMTVLRNVLAEEEHGKNTVARRLVLATKLPKKDQNSLLPLALAHRASLTALLRRKDELRARYSAFQLMLDARSNELTQRKEPLKLAEKGQLKPEVSSDAIQKAKKQMSVHWHGDTRWLDILMEGEQREVNDSVLNKPFEQTWKQVTSGHINEEAALDQCGLLKDLEMRIANQKSRVLKWKQFRDELAEETRAIGLNVSSVKDSADKQGLELDFRAHKDLTLRKDERASKAASLSASHPFQSDEYKDLIESMQRELQAVDQPRSGTSSTKDHGRQISAFSRPERLASQIDLPAQYGFTPAMPKIRTGRKPLQSDEQGYNVSRPETRKSTEQVSSKRSSALKTPKEIPPPHLKEEQPSLTTQSSFPDSTQPAETTPATELDEDEVLAAEILSLTINAAPSPVKPKSSLMERTRRSMAFPSVTEAQQMPSSSSLQKTSSPGARPNQPSRANFDAKATLLERTRQSMSGLPTHEPRKRTHEKRLSKQFPANQFETPQKQPARMEEIREGTPPEQLFSGDADYASIFKSRPRIAMSPTPSPMLGKQEANEHFDSSPLEGARY